MEDCKHNLPPNQCYFCSGIARQDEGDARNSEYLEIAFEEWARKQTKEATMNDFDHLTNHEAQEDPGVLQELAEAVAAWEAQKAEVEAAEEVLKEKKKHFTKISQEIIPELVLKAGFKKLVLANGKQVDVNQKLSASVKDMQKFAKFVHDRGDASIVKTTMEIGKLPEDILQKLLAHIYSNFNLAPEVKQTVHTQTLGKYLRELCGIGSPDSIPEMSLEELPEGMVNAYVYYTTKVG